MGWIGVYNNMGIGIMLAYVQQLANNKNESYNYTICQIMLLTIPILAIFLNAKLLITINHKTRVQWVTALFAFSYLLFAIVIQTQSLFMSVVTSIVVVFASKLGEATIMGYLKGVPQELITSFTTGVGGSIFFAFFAQLWFMIFGLNQTHWTLLFMLATLPTYYSSFMWIERNRIEHKQF
jgi:hypothetical protein